MANYKDYSYSQELLLPVSLSKQILPGTFEYTLNFLIDKKLDLSIFHEKYVNDEVGAPAYDPAIMLKIILYAYAKGIVSSRGIEQLCRENITCIALSADTKPHFTTIAKFISSLDTECIDLFTRILAVCYSEGLIGKNMFAIDGCKLSSNCSKEWSGTKKDMMKKVEKIKEAIDYLVKKHRESDETTEAPGQREKEKESIKKLQSKADKITQWLNENDDRVGAQGKPIKSNITDNESAKMSTSHGVIQGYNGIAAVDDKHQTVVWAEAFGDASESVHLPEILDGIRKNCREAEIHKDIYKKVTVTADSGFHNERNMEKIFTENIEAYVADNQFRKRDVRFVDYRDHKTKVENWKPVKKKKYFSPEDFHFDKTSGKLICPAGKEMWLKCKNFQTEKGRYQGKAYMGHVKDCMACSLRKKCIRKETTKARQVAIFDIGSKMVKVNYTQMMKDRFDSASGRSIYSRRMGTVEPVFGHIAGTKGLNRFTLRSRRKVNNQWLLYCTVHNIGKIQKYGNL